jgi:hypothetical protein
MCIEKIAIAEPEILVKKSEDVEEIINGYF